MSASLVRKSLAIVDPDLNTPSAKKKNKKNKPPTLNIPHQHKLIEKIQRGQKVDTVNLLNTTKKLSINDLRKKQKTSNTANLKKLSLLHEVCKIQLDKETTRQLFERAASRRPVRPKQKKKKSQKTAFTEEDFEKFEEEYFVE